MPRALFELTEKAFDKISIAAEEGAEGKALLAVSLGRDVGKSTDGLCFCPDGVGIVGLICQ